jgi:hypothetical protein
VLAHAVVSYLEAIQHTDYAPQRVLGTLAEMYLVIRDQAGYEEYRQKAHDYVESHASLAEPHLDALEEALDRAKNHLDRR